MLRHASLCFQKWKKCKIPLYVLFPVALSGCELETNDYTKPQLVDLTAIPPSAQCEFGGNEVRTGLDSNDNNVLEESEVSSSTYSCNPAEKVQITAASMSFNVAEDESLSAQLTAPDTDEAISYHLSLHPSKGMTTLNEDGSFTYTPHSNVVGSDFFTYNISVDGETSNTAVIEITIAPENDAPLAQSIDLYAYNSTLMQQQLVASDIDSSALTFSLQDSPNFGTASIDETGLLTYRAREGYMGADHITFSVSDGEHRSTADINITVTDTVLQISSESPAQYSVEQGVIEQQSTTLTNQGDEFVLVWTINWPQWYTLVTDVISIAPHSSIDIAFDVDTTNLAEGSYQGTVSYSSAEPGMPSHNQNLLLEVTENISAPATINDLATSGHVEFNQANLQWTAVADSGRRGLPVSSYDLRYSTSQITEENWDSAQAIAFSRSPSPAETLDSILITELIAETTYFFAIKSLDRNERVSGLSNVASFTTPLPPIPDVLRNATVTLKESEQTTVNIVLNNTGQSLLRYSANISSQAMTQASSQASIRSKPARQPLSVSSMASHSGNIIIKLNDSQPSARSFNELLSQYKLQERESIDSLNLRVVRPDQQDPAAFVQLINDLNNQPQVDYAEPDYNIQAFYLPNDAHFDDQWALNNEGQTGGGFDNDINAPETWENFRDASNMIVAVIDTGVDYGHQDLNANIWTNPGEIADNGLDDDNNGYVDDIHGYDFINTDADPMDDHAHGTHVAGIIGAKGNNGQGISGTAHTAQIMAVKFLSAYGGGSTSGAISSIVYAVDNGAKVLNNSWGGGPHSEALFDAIAYANEQDVLFLAAAGNASNDNDNTPSYPASYDLPNIISVASTDHNDQLSYFSNYGMSVDIAAPGSDILSTVPQDNYDTFSGTSMATPFVAGAAILIRSHFPQLSALETKEILLTNVDELAHLNEMVASGGRMNLHSALAAAAYSNYALITDGEAGEIAPGESATIQVSIDATDKLAGVYENTIAITTNAPGHEEIAVALSVTVEFDEEAPATVSDLQLNDISTDSALLQWTTPGDDGLTGKASVITLAYATTEITSESWAEAVHIGGPAPSDAGSSQEFRINGLLANTQYYFAMKVSDNSGQASALSNVVAATTPIGAILDAPTTIETVTLNEGESQTLPLLLSNLGDEQLDYRINLSAPVDDSSPTQQFQSVDHAKGAADLRTGAISPQGHGGPDNFGYTWADSDEGQVVFDWTDISSTGTSLIFGDDTVSPAVNLGFGFEFYGTEYNQVYVSSNGFLSFESTHNGCCSGQPLPSADIYQNLIAWAWKDLHPQGGSVHYQAIGDDFILQFTGYGEFGRAGTVTAQVILSSNGTIKLQYLSFNGFNTSNLSVGIENQDSSDGLQVVFNAAYLKDELAIEIATSLPWASVSQSSGSILAAASEEIELTFDASDVPPGNYQGAVIIESNDATQPEVTIPISMEVNALPE